MTRILILGLVVIAIGTVTKAKAQSTLLSLSSCRASLNVEIRASEIVQCMQAMIEQISSLQRENEALQNNINFLEQFGLPSGTVAMFDRECPVGWASYSQAAGRFVVGAGSGRRDGEGELLSVRKLGETGGVEAHALKPDEMPEHNHYLLNLRRGGEESDVDGVTPGSSYSDGAQLGRLWVGGAPIRSRQETSFAGLNRPHENMPPFVALNFCKKE